jgi:selenide,water dikinase
VASTLESVSHPRVFAAGDVSSFAPRPLPKAGVFAVRQGPVLADNLRRAALGQALKAYRPQRHWLVLISTGEHYAIGARSGVGFEGGWVWTLKDWIDRRFMSRYRDLPAPRSAA